MTKINLTYFIPVPAQALCGLTFNAAFLSSFSLTFQLSISLVFCSSFSPCWLFNIIHFCSFSLKAERGMRAAGVKGEHGDSIAELWKFRRGRWLAAEKRCRGVRKKARPASGACELNGENPRAERQAAVMSFPVWAEMELTGETHGLQQRIGSVGLWAEERGSSILQRRGGWAQKLGR